MKLSKFSIRFFVVLFWTATILAFLYFPNWKILPEEENSLVIFSWGDILDPDLVVDFEKKSGIKVRMNYYSSNEELLVKLRATEGAGYDLIMPSDYSVVPMIKEKLVKELDRSQLKFFTHLNPSLLGHFFDPDNRYSIPFSWEIYGLGVDKDYFATRPLDPSWRLIFDKKIVDYKISMINEPLEAITITGFYLFGKSTEFSDEELTAIHTLLGEQRAWVEAYANFRGDYFLATRNCPVAVATSSYMWKSKKLFPFIQFVIPREGTYITIENFCIPIKSKKEKAVYAFLNYIYSEESAASHFENYGFFPATLNVDKLTDLDEEAKKLLTTPKGDFGQFMFFNPAILPEEEVHKLWIELKTL
jgi:spermidine/putrescine transport system substrate-binding protein